jgi:hypothetical protein
MRRHEFEPQLPAKPEEEARGWLTQVVNRDWQGYQEALLAEVNPEFDLLTAEPEYLAGFTDHSLYYSMRTEQKQEKNRNSRTIVMGSVTVENSSKVIPELYAQSFPGISEVKQYNYRGDLLSYRWSTSAATKGLDVLTGIGRYTKLLKAEGRALGKFWSEREAGTLASYSAIELAERFAEIKAQPQALDLAPNELGTYLAGYFDTRSGNISIARGGDELKQFQLILTLYEESGVMLPLVQRLFPQGILKALEKGSNIQQLIYTNAQASALLEAVIPYSRLRRPQLRLALDFIRTQQAILTLQELQNSSGKFQEAIPNGQQLKEDLRSSYQELMGELYQHIYGIPGHYKQIAEGSD